MNISRTAIADVLLIEPKRIGDARGYFMETFRADKLAEAGVTVPFVQDNQSLSRPAGTLRGLHFQTPPFAQAKLVRVLKGRILDVAVDLRLGSPSYLKHVAVELSADNALQLYIPEGFAHGFLTLEADCEVAYKVSAPYAPQCDRGLRFDDPAIGISWPNIVDPDLLSPKDRGLPTVAALEGQSQWPVWTA